jgi:NADP-dependent 3-hydroxy acid dehydrogenase YdfG
MTILNVSIYLMFLELHLASQDSVHKAAAEVNTCVDQIDVLVNKAGVKAVSEFDTAKERNN